MSNRVLATYEEDRLPDGPHWTLEIRRSAAGQPGILVTIRSEMHDPKYSHLDQEMTVVVSDGREVLAPVMDWLDRKPSGHQHERWMLREAPDGGLYCAACGEEVE